jgi:hypothetical protein
VEYFRVSLRRERSSSSVLLYRLVSYEFTDALNVLTASIIRANIIVLMMEALNTCEASVNFYKTAGRSIPGDYSHFHVWIIGDSDQGWGKIFISVYRMYIHEARSCCVIHFPNSCYIITLSLCFALSNHPFAISLLNNVQTDYANYQDLLLGYLEPHS